MQIPIQMSSRFTIKTIRSFHVLFFLISLTFFAVNTYGSHFSLSNSTKDNKLLNESCRFFIDSSRALSIDSVKKISGKSWEEYRKLPYNGGYNSFPVWLRIQMIDSSQNNPGWILSFNHPLLDSIAVYLVTDSSVKLYTLNGLQVEKKWPSMKEARSAFVLPEMRGEAYELLIKVHTHDACAISLSYDNIYEYHKSSSSKNLTYGFYFGAISLISFINIFLFLKARFNSCLLYAAYIITFALFVGSTNGFFNISVLKVNILVKAAGPFFAGSTFLFGSEFAKNFLSLKRSTDPLFWYIYTLISVLGLALCIFSPIENTRFLLMGVNIIAPFLVSICLITGIFKIKSRGRSAIFFTCAASMLASGVILRSFRNFGLVPSNFLTAYGNLIGSALEFTILALALVDRISTIQDEKNSAQEKIQTASRLATESRFQALQAQINPHFLFNTLNTIAEFICLDSHKAEKLVLNLSKFFRYTLTASKEKLLPLSKELDIVEDYLSIEKERFGERLKYDITVEGDPKKVSSLGLLIQPLVENSIKYGVAPLPEGATIKIECEISEDKVAIRVSDSGRGFKSYIQATETGTGIKNINERLQLTYGSKGKLVCSNDNGAVVLITFPREKWMS